MISLSDCVVDSMLVLVRASKYCCRFIYYIEEFIHVNTGSLNI
jgi:hypothetical protein